MSIYTLSCGSVLMKLSFKAKRIPEVTEQNRWGLLFPNNSFKCGLKLAGFL